MIVCHERSNGMAAAPKFLRFSQGLIPEDPHQKKNKCALHHDIKLPPASNIRLSSVGGGEWSEDGRATSMVCQETSNAMAAAPKFLRFSQGLIPQHHQCYTEDPVMIHYSARLDRTAEERQSSPIIRLRNLSNWVKSVVIQLYTRRGHSVLDIACGKGGDLLKWEKAKIGSYVGLDLAPGSIKDALNRVHGRKTPLSFPARLICADCYGVALDEALKDDAPFDICSCQFALHYSWSSEERARLALANISTMLKPGGYFIGTLPDANVIVKKLRQAQGLTFGNTVYNIKFHQSHHQKTFHSAQPFGIEYHFHLVDAVDGCPEWLVPFSQLQSLAAEYGLQLLWKKNFHEFVHEHIQRQDFAELMRRLGALGDGTSRDTISPDEWDAASLYTAFAFQKRGNPNQHSQGCTMA